MNTLFKVVAIFFCVEGVFCNQGCQWHAIDKASGTFSSPGYPNDYPSYVNCVLVSLDSHIYESIELTFDSFDVEFRYSCTDDYLKIGSERYCGKSLTGQTLVRKLPLEIRFVSDGAKQFHGFHGSYKYLHKDCILHSVNRLEGTVHSPGYPYHYPNNFACIYTFPIKGTYRNVQLYFKKFDLESSENCIYDKLKIAGQSYCGVELQGRHETFKLPLTMTFETYKAHSREGFLANYRYMNPDCPVHHVSETEGYFVSPWPGYSDNCSFSIPYKSGYHKVQIYFQKFNVGSYASLMIGNMRYNGTELLHQAVYTDLPAVLKSESSGDVTVGGYKANFTYWPDCDLHMLSPVKGYFQSPGYPNEYPDGSHCHFDIPAKFGSAGVSIFFIYFDLESGYDYLAGHTGDSLNHATIYRDLPTRLTFKTDSSGRHKGFRAFYTYNETCHVNFDSWNSGSFKSPGYPNNYPNHFHCVYYIPRKPNYNAVSIYFSSFKLESSSPCQYDILTLGYSKYCGNQLNQKTVKVSLPAFIKFDTDSSEAHTGFSATFYLV